MNTPHVTRECTVIRPTSWRKQWSRVSWKAGGSGRGSLIINEFGQVLVPASDDDGQAILGWAT